MPSAMSSEPARVLRYESEVPISGTRSAVWHALTQELPTWWLRDFHVIDPKSEMQLEPIADLKGHVEAGGIAIA